MEIPKKGILMAYVSNHRKWFGMGFPKKEILMDYISIFGRHFPKKLTKKGNLMSYVSRLHDPLKNENGKQVGMLT